LNQERPDFSVYTEQDISDWKFEPPPMNLLIEIQEMNKFLLVHEKKSENLSSQKSLSKDKKEMHKTLWFRVKEGRFDSENKMICNTFIDQDSVYNTQRAGVLALENLKKKSTKSRQRSKNK